MALMFLCFVFFMLSVIYVECRKQAMLSYVTSYVECRYAECRYEECRGTNTVLHSQN